MVHFSALRHSDYLSDGAEYGIKRDSATIEKTENEDTSAMIVPDVNKQIDLLSESDREYIRRTRLLRNRLFGIDALTDCLNPWDSEAGSSEHLRLHEESLRHPARAFMIFRGMMILLDAILPARYREGLSILLTFCIYSFWLAVPYNIINGV